VLSSFFHFIVCQTTSSLIEMQFGTPEFCYKLLIFLDRFFITLFFDQRLFG